MEYFVGNDFVDQVFDGDHFVEFLFFSKLEFEEFGNPAYFWLSHMEQKINIIQLFLLLTSKKWNNQTKSPPDKKIKKLIPRDVFLYFIKWQKFHANRLSLTIVALFLFSHQKNNCTYRARCGWRRYSCVDGHLYRGKIDLKIVGHPQTSPARLWRSDLLRASGKGYHL